MIRVALTKGNSLPPFTELWAFNDHALSERRVVQDTCAVAIGGWLVPIKPGAP
jgi:hypothetical protein